MTVIEIRPTDRANEKSTQLRQARAEVKRDIRAGRLPIDRALTCPPEPIRALACFDVLQLIPGFGASKLRQTFSLAMDAGMNLACSIGELTAHDAAWLAAVTIAIRRGGDSNRYAWLGKTSSLEAVSVLARDGEDLIAVLQDECGLHLARLNARDGVIGPVGDRAPTGLGDAVRILRESGSAATPHQALVA